MPLRGTPIDEADRRRAWIATESAYRHTADASKVWTPISTVLVQILRAARAPEYIQACRHFRCDACEDNKPKHQSTKVALPKDYVLRSESRHRCSGNHVEESYPTPHIHEQMTTSNYGYDTAYNFTHNNIMLEPNAMNNMDTVAHMNVHNTQY